MIILLLALGWVVFIIFYLVFFVQLLLKIRRSRRASRTQLETEHEEASRRDRMRAVNLGNDS